MVPLVVCGVSSLTATALKSSNSIPLTEKAFSCSSRFLSELRTCNSIPSSSLQYNVSIVLFFTLRIHITEFHNCYIISTRLTEFLVLGLVFSE